MQDILAMVNDDDSLYSSVIKNGLENRILIINEEISDSLLENIIYHILRWNIEDKNLPVDKRTPIKLILNSMGGDVFTEQNITDVIETSKTPVYGIAMGIVASAAYYIFIGCHKRIAFKNSVLLQHDGNVLIQNSNSKAKDMMKFFNSMDERTKNYVLSHSSITEEFYDSHYDSEYYMYADTTGKELGVVDAIIGVDIDLYDIF